jgi:hypothetical protein
VNITNLAASVAVAQKASEASIDQDRLDTVNGVPWGGSGLPFSKVADIKDSLVGTVLGRVVLDRHGIDRTTASAGDLGSLIANSIIKTPFSYPEPIKLVYVSLWGSNSRGCFAELIIQYSTFAGDDQEKVKQEIVPKQLEIGINGQVVTLNPQPVSADKYSSENYTYSTERNGRDVTLPGTWYMARNLFKVDSSKASILSSAKPEQVKARITLANDQTILFPIGKKTVARWKDAYSYNPYCMPANKVQPGASQSDDEDEDEDTTSTQVSATSQQSQPASSSAAPVRQASASGNKPSAGEVALAATQTLGNVDVNLDGAYVNTSGRFIANLTIQNRSDRNFGFVPLFAKVQDANGQNVPARVSVDTNTNAVVSPGKSMKAQVYVLGKRWNNTGSQNLILTIKEGSTGGRTFRIPF